jgi:hypothetical protein
MSDNQNTRQAAGPRSTGGMASSTTTPANAGVGEHNTSTNMMDAQGAIGKQFTGKTAGHND